MKPSEQRNGKGSPDLVDGIDGSVEQKKKGI